MKLLDLLDKLDLLEVDINNKSNSRFVTSDISFFNLFYNDKSINITFEVKYSEKKIYFYNVVIFINRIKDIV